MLSFKCKLIGEKNKFIKIYRKLIENNLWDHCVEEDSKNIKIYSFFYTQLVFKIKLTKKKSQKKQ